MTRPLLPAPVYRPFRVRLLRLACRLVIGGLLRIRVEGRQRFAQGPAIYCFNHLNWVDPMVLIAALPPRPRYAMFGPREADMRVGARNRLIAWAGFGIPYRPSKTDLVETTRRVGRVLDDGWVIVIAGEGRIHRGEHELLPLAAGTAYFALRSGVPIIPLAINGTTWLSFRRGVRIRVGEPILGEGRPTSEAVDALTALIAAALHAMTADFPDPPPPGRLFRRLTELFNDWPEGARPELGSGDGAIAHDATPAAELGATAADREPDPDPAEHPAG